MAPTRFPSSAVNSTDRREEVRTEQGTNQKVFVAREEWEQQDTAMTNEFLQYFRELGSIYPSRI